MLEFFASQVRSPTHNRLPKKSFFESDSWGHGSASPPGRGAADPALATPLPAAATPTACRMPYRRLTSGSLLSLAARKMASIMEGPLSKWTNVMKGWQYRWFVLDYNAGLLSYYTVSPRRQSPERLGGRDPWVEVGTGRFGSREEVARLGVQPYGRAPSWGRVLRP